jgi:hypothetical protein
VKSDFGDVWVLGCAFAGVLLILAVLLLMLSTMHAWLGASHG